MDLDVRERVISLAVEQLDRARWEIPKDFLTFQHYLRVVQRLDWNSSPGYPLVLHFADNRQLFNVDPFGNIDLQRLTWVWQMVKRQIDKRLSDPIRLFIKPEPHSQRKLDSCRYRIISSVALIDQIIDHMLFDELNQNLVRECHRIPVKSGWTPLTGGWREVPVGEVISTDKSSFDWTVCMWALEAELEIRMRLCDNLTSEWVDLAKWRYSELYERPIFVTSGGLQMQQMQPGVMKSGCVNTISTNSILQLVIHYRVAFEIGEDPPALWAMGDDVIQEKVTREYFDRLERYCHLKEVSRHVEFAGYRFNRYHIEPLYFGKHAFMLLHSKPDFHVETADSYALLYHRSKRNLLMREILDQLNPKLVEPERLDRIWNEYQHFTQ